MSLINTNEAPRLGAALIPRVLTEWNVPEVSRYSRQAAIENRVYIFNVGPTPHFKATPLGPHLIPACPEGALHSEPCVIDGVIFETIPKAGTERDMEIREVDGEAFARDLVGIGPHQNYRDSLARQGVFIAKGPVPTDEELEKAREALEALWSEWVADGDHKQSLNNGTIIIDGTPQSSISQRHIQAVKGLGLKRSYVTGNRKQVECDQCGEANLTTASRCKSCRKVFDEEKDRKNYPFEYEGTEPERRGPGRPPKVQAA